MATSSSPPPHNKRIAAAASLLQSAYPTPAASPARRASLAASSGTTPLPNHAKDASTTATAEEGTPPPPPPPLGPVLAKHAKQLTLAACTAVYRFLRLAYLHVPWAQLTQDAILSATPLALIAFFTLYESTKTSLDAHPPLSHPLPFPLRSLLQHRVDASLAALGWCYPLLALSLLAATFAPQALPLLRRLLTAAPSKPIPPPTLNLLPPPTPLRTTLTAVVLFGVLTATSSLTSLSSSVAAELHDAALATTWNLTDPRDLRFVPIDPTALGLPPSPPNTLVSASLLFPSDDPPPHDTSSLTQSLFRALMSSSFLPPTAVPNPTPLCPPTLHLTTTPLLLLTPMATPLHTSPHDPSLALRCDRTRSCVCPLHALHACLALRTLHP
ncbi:hypothetical protein HDU96_003318, partial [Phlyctochytrium bullatum]